MPKEQSRADNEAEYGDDYYKSEHLMGDLTQAVCSQEGRNKMGQKVGNYVDSSDQTLSAHHGIDG